MTKAEFQKLHEFSDEDMDRIDMIIKMFKGKISNIENIKK
jgi:hypothetical protein